jgi:hypothetical protein
LRKKLFPDPKYSLVSLNLNLNLFFDYVSYRRGKLMDERLKELARMIDEADKLADKIKQTSGGMQVIERNVERMKACIKMMRIGVLEPVELG